MKGGSAAGGTATGGTTRGGAATGGTPTGGTSAGTASTGTIGGPAVKSAGCSKTPTLKNGIIKLGSREYTIDIPADYDNTKAYRLVFGVHWIGSTDEQVATGSTEGGTRWSYFGLKRLDTPRATIFIAPQGVGGNWGNSGGSDIKFFNDILDQVEADLCIDTSRIFAIGFSYGASMSYSIGCAMADRVRAVIPQDGAVMSGCSPGTSPIAYMGVHGVGDGTLGIAGGRSMRDKFVGLNGCTKPATVDETKSGSKSHVCYKYQGCKAGYPVEWCTFDGGHIAAPADGGSVDNGETTWVPKEAWAFITQF